MNSGSSRRRFLLSLSLSLLCAVLTTPARENDDVRYVAEMDRLISGNEIVSMGGCGVALPASPFAVLANPALPGLDRHWRADCEGVKTFGGISSLGAASGSIPVTKDLAIAGTYRAFFSGPITQYDSLSLPEEQARLNYPVDGYKGRGTFRNNQHAITVSAARNFAINIPRPSDFALPLPIDLSGGISARSLIHTLDPAGRERMGMLVNIDAGFALRFGFDWDIADNAARREFIIAASLQNLLPTQMMWLYSDYAEPSRMTRSYGLSFTDRSGFLHGAYTGTMGFISHEDEVSGHIGLDAEFFDVVSFRAGYGTKTWALGAGLRWKWIHVDYALTFDELAYTVVRFGVGGDW